MRMTNVLEPAASGSQWLMRGLCLTLLITLLHAHQFSRAGNDPIIPNHAITADSGDVVKKIEPQSLDDNSAPVVSGKSLPENHRAVLVNQAFHLILVFDKPELQPLLPQGPPA